MMDFIEPPQEALKPRELDILRLMADGLTNREIAERLVIGVETVRWYAKQIYAKLDVNGREEASDRAFALGLLEDEAHAPREPLQSRRNLPMPLTSFIGREAQIQEVIHLLQTARLVTLTGPGGTGKTRLSLRVAEYLAEDFADGVYFVDLSPLADPDLIPSAIGDALEIAENSAETVTETLIRVLTGRELLLIIDNFEHLLDGVWVVLELLTAIPHLKILVTSRQGLRLSGEQVYPVPPLTLPEPSPKLTPDALLAYEAIALFLQRARAVRPDFNLTPDNAADIIEICDRLDGMPLALELAAARTNLLTARTIVERLDQRFSTLTGGSRDAPARQKTLRAIIDWSYNLLDEGERILFRRLGVFQGGRTLDAIEAVCSEGLPVNVLDALASLIDKSMVRQDEDALGEPRFMMLETIGAYARERLQDSGEYDIMRQRHAEYFLAFAERAEPELRLARQYEWLKRLETDHDNFRVALEWALASNQAEIAVRMAGALGLFWNANGHHVEGRRWMDRVIACLDDVPLQFHPKLLNNAGVIGWMQTDDTAMKLHSRGLQAAQQLGDKESEAWALTYISFPMWGLGDAEAALAAAEKGVQLFRELGHKPGQAQALNAVGEIARVSGDDVRARQAYQECLTLSRETGEQRRVTMLCANLGFIAEHQGDSEAAKSLYEDSLRLAYRLSDRLMTTDAVTFLGGIIGIQGEPERGARLMGAAEAARQAMGAFLQPSDRPEAERQLALLHTMLDKTRFEKAWEEGRNMSLSDAVNDLLGE